MPAIHPTHIVPTDDPLLLALETATDSCGVALARGAEVLVAQTLGTPRSHAEWLPALIQDALRYAHVRPEDLDAVAVSMGPGSYTGLRIGVSAAKGLCFARGIPLIGIPTLEALAWVCLPFTQPGDRMAVALNSRRDEVYLGVFEALDGGGMAETVPASALAVAETPAVMPTAYPGALWVIGEGARAIEAGCRAVAGDATRLVPGIAPSPVTVARRGLERWRQGAFEDLASFEPFYLKDFIPLEKRGTLFDRLPFGGKAT
ncbi:MAG: tRNA (adenosine(37)-N6)-threonylcarbamoyltransferase complex dimerization subunit type 1 TsaB [Rhodothermales bacterium]